MTSCTIGKTREITISTGLRRKRLNSRSMIGNAPLMLSSTSWDGELAVERRCILQRISQLSSRVMNEHIVQRGALDRQGLNRNLFRRRGSQKCHGCGWTVVSRDAKDVVLPRHRIDIR